MVPLLEKHVPQILAAINAKLQKHNEAVVVPVAEPMVIVEKTVPREPAWGSVPEVKFCNEDNPGKLFQTATRQIKLNEPWTILNYWDQDEAKEEASLEMTEERKEAAAASKKSKSKALPKTQKTAQKYSKKLEKLHRLAQSSSDAGRKRAKEDK